MSRQYLADMPVDATQASFGAISTTTTETALWNPGLAVTTPIPAGDMRAGKVYKVNFGGILSTTVTPTVAWTLRFGTNNSAPPTGTLLGASTAVATGSGLASVPFFGEAYVVVRSIGVAASTATVTGNGFVALGNVAAAAAQVAVFGSAVPTTVDATVAQGISVSITWGTSSASNTVTTQWLAFQTLN